MIVQILCNLFEEGYQRTHADSFIAPFFPGSNVAFRRQALSDAGPYDRRCRTGEDQDMFLRVAKAGWEVYFEPRALVRHKNRLTLRALLRQWFNYGANHPYVTGKHNTRGLRIYRPRSGRRRGPIYRPLLELRCPIFASIFLTEFLIIHVLGALAILFAAIGLQVPAIVFGAGTLAVALKYFRRDMDVREPVRSCSFVFIRYLANLALIAAGLWGGLKMRMLYIGPTFDCRG